MRLLALRPQFIAYIQRNDEGVLRNFHVWVRTLSEADGIRFLCPVCLVDGKGPARYTHSVICWFEGRVPDDAVPGPGRWNPRGHGYKDLSFVPGVKSKERAADRRLQRALSPHGRRGAPVMPTGITDIKMGRSWRRPLGAEIR